MNKKQNVGILHCVNLYIYFDDIWQTFVRWMIKSHIWNVHYVHENCKFLTCTFS